MKILSLSIDLDIYAHASVHVCAFHTNLRAAVRQRGVKNVRLRLWSKGGKKDCQAWGKIKD